MITAAQLRAARALLGIDQRQLAALSGLSVPTVELIDEGTVSRGGGRGVRLKAQATRAATDRDEGLTISTSQAA